MKSIVAVVVLAASAPLAAAQQQAAKTHPADPTAPVPVARYESVLSGYRGYREEPLAPWREVNDEVARAGGHIGIVGGAGRHAPASGSPLAKPAAPPVKSAPGSIQN